MKYSYILLIGCLIFLGGACQKREVPAEHEAQNPADCEQAEYRFACYLDRAMAAQDPVLCNDVGVAQRATCLSAYEEIFMTQVDCMTLPDSQFQQECALNHQAIEQAQEESAQMDTSLSTSTSDLEE